MLSVLGIAVAVDVYPCQSILGYTLAPIVICPSVLAEMGTVANLRQTTVFTINSLKPSNAYMRRQSIIGSDNGLSPDRRQAIIWTYTEILLIGP